MDKKDLRNISGLLFDLDGVLYIGSTLIEGAPAVIEEIKRRGLKCRFITNTSTLSRSSLHTKLIRLGLPIEPGEIFSAAQAALLYVQSFTNPVCHLVLAEDVRKDFAHLAQSEHKADFVIVGDIGEAWSYPLLNKVFNLLMNGAQLVAIHKNRFWQTERGLQMDIGAFITGLEYATRKQALIIGKPSRDYFETALADMDLPATQVAIIGDDIDSDIGGGQDAGLRGILVKTGKFRQDYADKSAIIPDYIIDSITNLPDLLAHKTG
ncbi:MAG: TIGR01458 family HAD-type hydrolase [Gammaproteobacteria bacterium]